MQEIMSYFVTFCFYFVFAAPILVYLYFRLFVNKDI